MHAGGRCQLTWPGRLDDWTPGGQPDPTTTWSCATAARFGPHHRTVRCQYEYVHRLRRIERKRMSETSYRRIDADTHVNEPPKLWIDRVPSKYRDRAPRMEHLEQGDAWVVEGAPDPINFGFNAAAGIPRDQRRPWVRFDEIRPGGYEPA